ncbi:MAG: S41 family peptidase, partial [Chloroflexota bacterium]
MDLESIPTEPTTDPEPPAATQVVTGSSLAPVSSAAGRARGSRLRRAAIGLALVLTFSVGIGIGRLGLPVLDGLGTTTPSPSSGTAPTDFGLIREAWDTLHTKYVGADQLDDKALIYGAIDGMTQAVGDTGHTTFLTPEQRAANSTGLSGSYVGIGVRIDTASDGLPLVVGVFPASPAEGAHLAAGDEIVAVDGKPAAGHTINEIIGWVRGPAGSTVKVTVRAGASGTPRDVSMVRADVAVDPVSWTLVPGTMTALIRLEQFSSGAADDLIKAIGLARTTGADRIVLDLRGNPGGYVNEADAVASQFLKDGVVFIERAADGHETSHAVKPGGVATDLPLVVLVDGNTASASEIVSGAIQDAAHAK